MYYNSYNQNYFNELNKIFEFIKLLVYTEQRVRDIIPPYELDIYIPDKKIAIEYDGLHWHSEIHNENKNRKGDGYAPRLE